MAIKVALRKKTISKKRLSLYLDFYPPILNTKTGKLTRREFLGSYIHEKPTNPIEKESNKQTLQLAEMIRHKRENELNKPEIYTKEEKERLLIAEKEDRNFVEYFTALCDLRKASNHDNWVSARNYLIDFTKGELKFRDLNEQWCNSFKEFLLNSKSRKSEKKNLATNSAVSYFNKIKAAMKQAFKDGILQTDVNSKVKPIKAQETVRQHLTLEELNRLVQTPCNYPLMKKAALFSALTGLRFSDIQKLKWSEVERIEGQGVLITFHQKKTKGMEVLPISDQALRLMGDERNDSELVFEGLTYSAYNNKHLFQWIGAAGISKDITFHCFRHTYAVLQLQKGTSIYTVSKMLGHKDLKTTQLYANIVDEQKRQASEQIVLDM